MRWTGGQRCLARDTRFLVSVSASGFSADKTSKIFATSNFSLPSKSYRASHDLHLEVSTVVCCQHFNECVALEMDNFAMQAP